MKIPGFSGACSRNPGSAWAVASGPLRIEPQVVLEPLSVADVCASVRWASGEGRSITPRAAATGMPGGNQGHDTLLDLGPDGPFAWVGEVDAHERRVAVGAGAIAADVNRAAADVGLSLPALPSSADRCTIGGMVANNAAGARSFKYGAIAERVWALTVVDAQGEVHRLERGDDGADPFAAAARLAPSIEHWPAVTKNSSGYGLDRFNRTGDGVDVLVGSEGTLGVIVEVVLELIPPADRHRTAVVGVASDEALLEWTDFARTQRLSACEFIGPWLLDSAGLARDPAFSEVASGAKYLILLEAAGSESEVATSISALGVFARTTKCSWVSATSADDQEALWGLRRRASPAIARAAASGHRSMQFIEDSVVPPNALGRYLSGVAALIKDVGFEAAVFGHAGDANVHVNPLVPIYESDWLSRVRDLLEGTVRLVRELGGTLAGEHGDGRIRAPFLHEIWNPEAFGAFTALKKALDPEGTLNRGVVVPTPGQDPLDGLNDPRNDASVGARSVR